MCVFCVLNAKKDANCELFLPLQISWKESNPFRTSERSIPKTIDRLKNNAGNRSIFETVYSNGGVPCILQHGSVKCIDLTGRPN